MKLKDLAGQVFGSQVVLRCVGRDRHGQALWLCRCACGNERSVTGGRLRRGESKSCGCRKPDALRAANITHGASVRGHMTVEYRCWQMIIDRCERPGNKSFKDYGERGIKIADVWRHDFPAFLAHVGPRPTDKHSIDRIKNDLGYQPGNVRWATRTEQNRNKRSVVMVTIDGQTKPYLEWAAENGIGQRAAYERIRNGWHPIAAVSEPIRGWSAGRSRVAPRVKISQLKLAV